MVVGNWKMNPTTWREAKKNYLTLKQSARRWRHIEVITAPPGLYLPGLADYSRPRSFALAGQNCHFQEAGSYTGELSPVMLKEAGADYCILGHSERRAAGEDNELIAKKTAAALAAGLRPIVCVGETVRDEEGAYLAGLEKQITDSVSTLSDKQLSELTVAYEPVWAIGRSDNRALTGERIYEMVIFIRRALTRRYNRQAAFSVPVLYGGSVTPANTSEIMTQGGVKGLLVGRQSLEPESFKNIIDIVEEVTQSN